MKITYLIGLSLLSVVSFGQNLSLESAKHQALEKNLKVINSKLETDAAKELKKDAYTKYFPQITGNVLGMKAINPLLEMNMKGGNLPVYDGNPANLLAPTQFAYMPDINMGLFNQMAVGYVSLQQPIYAGNKINTGNRLAELNIEVKEKQEILSKNEITLKVEQQYWLVVSLQEKQKTLENYIALLANLKQQVDNAYKNGLTLKNDVLKVSIKQSELQVGKNQLQNGKKLALMQLCQTIGMEYNENLILQDDLSSFQNPLSYVVSHQEVMHYRPEYQLFEKGVKASELESNMKKGDYLPSIGVGITGYYLNQLQGGLDGSFNGMVYGSVSFPISEIWNKKHKLKELEVKEKIARNNLQDGAGLLNLQMEKAKVDLMEANEKIKLIQETLEQARENVELAKRSYDNGLVNLSDLLEAQTLRTETEEKLIEAQAHYKLAISTYKQVTGR